MDMMNVTGGLAWGVPVRPDLLGEALQAYHEILPTLTALRLCHRFGTGPNVHVTKLPNEILLAIEEMLFDWRIERSWDAWEWPLQGWSSEFMHFERKCAPGHHTWDFPSPEHDQACDETKKDLCEKCRDPDACYVDCEVCHEMVENRVDEILSENYEYQYEFCQERRQAWERMIDQKPKGNFVKYDEILHRVFGLRAYFAKTRVEEGKTPNWSSHKNHKWHAKDELETTICYLTLPTEMMKPRRYIPSDWEAEGSLVSIPVVRSSFVNLSSIGKRSQRVAQFRGALRTLKLKPFIHPSQLNETIESMVLPDSDDESGNEESHEGDSSGDESDEESAEQAISKIEWPQRIMLIQASPYSRW